MNFPIRPAVADDSQRIEAIAVEAGMFSQEEAQQVIGSLLSSHFSSGAESTHLIYVAEEGIGVSGNRAQGVVIGEPVVATDRVWKCLMIGVTPELQGKGVGGKLLAELESELKTREARLMIVETSASLSQARVFYIKQGYQEEASIKNYWAENEHLVICTKPLI